MRTRILAPLVTAAMAGGLLVSVAGPATAAAPQAQVTAPAAQKARATFSSTPISQPVTYNGTSGTLTGTFTPTQFLTQNGQLLVQGVFNGAVKDAAGNVLLNIQNAAIAPTAVNGASTSGLTSPAAAGTMAAAAAGSCDILHLTLGPLHLNVLGLVVDLNQVKLDVTAQRGPGNLLGNLLCTVAGLLDNGTGLQGVVNILNGLLAGL